MKKSLVIPLLFFIGFTINSCSTPKEMLPGIDTPVNDMNKVVRLIPNPSVSTMPRNNEPFDVQMMNLSTKPIVFAGDYGMKLFIKQDQQWLPFENNLIHYPEGEVILPRDKDSPGGLFFVIYPFIVGLDRPGMLRVVVSGHFMEEPDTVIYGYTDIKLLP